MDEKLEDKLFGTRLPPISGVNFSEEEPLRIIYIAGVGRSGSTLVERWLGECFHLATPGELASVWAQGVLSNEKCGCGARFFDCEYWRDVGDRAFGGWTQELASEVIRLQDRYCRLRNIAPLLGWRSKTNRANLNRLRDVNYAVLSAIQALSSAAGVVDSSKQFPRLLLLRSDARLECIPLNLVRPVRMVIRSWARAKARPHSGEVQTEMRRRSPLPVAVEWLVVNFLFTILRWRSAQGGRLQFPDFLETRGPLTDWLYPTFPMRESTQHASVAANQLVLSRAHGMGGNSTRFQEGIVRLVKSDGERSDSVHRRTTDGEPKPHVKRRIRSDRDVD